MKLLVVISWVPGNRGSRFRGNDGASLYGGREVLQAE